MSTGFRFLLLSVIASSIILFGVFGENKPEILVLTVATSETDGFTRFMHSITKYGLPVKVIGMGQEWKGGEIEIHPGGGFKVNLLKEVLKEYKSRDDLLIMFTDSYDVVFTNNANEIRNRFNKFNAKVIFSAEGFCWPDRTLAENYPGVSVNEKRYLNSGGFIGYASQIYEIVTSSDIKDTDDDQLFYTKIFLDPILREKWGIKLDTRAEIFQNLNGALDEVSIKFKGSTSFLYNVKTGTVPIVAHGNGPIKPEFNRIANYLVDGWTLTNGCQSCKENTISLAGFKPEDYPTVYIALFIDHATPFIKEWFERIASLDYPKSKVDIYVHNRIDYHKKDVKQFVKMHKKSYNTMKVIDSHEALNLWAERNHAIDQCIKHDCQYYLAVDSDAQLTNPKLLASMIEQNRSVIAPLLSRPGKLWSNFWGALNSDGFYARSDDYLDILNDVKKGLWNVPFVRDVLLIHGSVVTQIKDGYSNDRFDPDMAICKTLRQKGVFMHILNLESYGHLVNSDYYDTTHLHNEMYQIFDNRQDWDNRYIHENYSRQLIPEFEIKQPCPDVYWFPVLSKAFCTELIEEMEHFGQWSNGKNQDTRLTGGYENVPTRDIHMNQIGLEKHWLHLVKEFIVPIQLKVFPGYYSKANSIMNFVVRYRPDEQPLLRPHHDSSTFTLNLALNEPGVDYEGGGCRFLRYNCSITENSPGMATIHPGRLTHYHEGLRTTAGTRYIMISFIDP